MESKTMTRTVKAYKGMGMEGGVARWYDSTTRRDMPEFVRLAARIAAQAPPSAAVLEIAPGPGFLSIELAKRGLAVCAVDISRSFVDIARRNGAAAGVTARFEMGDAAALPVPDSSVDFVVCRAAFKNFSRPVAAMAEMRRVLRPGGTALLIDMRHDVPIAEVKAYVDGLGVGWLNRRILFAGRHRPHGGRGRLARASNRGRAARVRGVADPLAPPQLFSSGKSFTGRRPGSVCRKA
jgi:ubiquinone/menaquinone biosynthesis C-methylase UbiE